MHTQEEIDDSKIELASSLKRLYKNKDFKKIVLDGYLETGSVFLAKNLTRVMEAQEDGVIMEIKARSILWKYLDSIELDANSIMEARAYEPKEV